MYVFYFSENIYNFLGKRLEYDRDMYMSCLQFLSFLFGEEGKLQGRQLDSSDGLVSLTQLLDKALQPGNTIKDDTFITYINLIFTLEILIQ